MWCGVVFIGGEVWYVVVARYMFVMWYAVGSEVCGVRIPVGVRYVVCYVVGARYVVWYVVAARFVVWYVVWYAKYKHVVRYA